MKLGLGCLVFIVIGLLLAVYFINRKTTYTGDHFPTNGNTVTIFLIDGMVQDKFEQALDKGHLPNLKSLIDKGTYVKNGIGAFPSMTGYAFYPFITGVDAAKSGILGLRWFDRSLDKGNLRNYVGRSNVYMNHDVTDTIQNIFELSGEMYTSSINSYMNKGVADSRMTGWAHTTAKFEGKSIFGPMRSIPLVGKELAKDHFQHESEVLKMAKDQLLQNPKVQWITLPSPDASHHVFGMTDTYTLLIRHIDDLIGDFMETVDQIGQGDTRMIAVVTDHGVSDVEKNLDIEPLAKAKIGLDLIRGNAVNYRSMVLDTPLEDFVDKDGYWVINGNLSAYLYMRDPAKTGTISWRNNLSYEDLLNYKKGNTTINIPKALADLEGIELVIYKKDKNNIVVQNKTGHALISKIRDKYKYQTVSADPLEYGSMHLSDTLLTKDEWLAMTIHTNYPDAVFRLFSLMSAPNIGDLVITSEEGYDLAKNYEVIVNNYKGGHGGLRSGQLRVPYIIYAPGLAQQSIEYTRAEDVGKMIMNWLGFKAS
ncbi:MAG: alkaline phosphatase family protein [Bacteroidota bacterium]